MAHNEHLARRVRTLLKGMRGLEEKKMFGGVGFMLRGNMAVGVHKDSLIARVKPESTGSVLKRPYTRPFDISGRPMQGWVLVSDEGCRTRGALGKWVEESVAYAKSLPPK